MKTVPLFLLPLTLSSLATAQTYQSVNITLKQTTGQLRVAPSTATTPTLGVKTPTVKAGVAYVSASHETGDWAVGLSPRLPLALTIRQDTGSMDLNLRGLPLTALNLMGTTSDIQLVLPSRSLTANITQDTGSLNLYLPADTGLQVVIQNFGTGSLVVEGQEVASGIALTGSYKTANYDSARNRITLNLKMTTGDVKVFKPGAPAPRLNTK